MLDPAQFILQDQSVRIDSETETGILDFYTKINTLEKHLVKPILILNDRKTDVFYIECHISTEEFIKYKDEDATLDPEFQEEYRLNRALQPDNPDFIRMKDDAKKGRQFSDIVIEYNTEYKSEKPLKILGGQHRSKAIEEGAPKGSVHGFRIYFNLNKEKRAEVAIVSNTNIAISDDLLDRLEEQRLEPPNKLRDFAHHIGILEPNKDFADRKTNTENLPTVRLLRAFIVNYYKGKVFKKDYDELPLESYLCQFGGMDPEYKNIFDKIKDFRQEKDLVETGKSFVKLHRHQFSIASKKPELKRKKEYRNKAMALSIISSWAFVSGLLQNDKTRLLKLFSLPDKTKSNDPLNAIAMSNFKLPPYDAENYRGLATRADEKERGRMVKVFLEYSKKENSDKIDPSLLKKAVQLYHAAKLTANALQG